MKKSNCSWNFKRAELITLRRLKTLNRNEYAKVCLPDKEDVNDEEELKDQRLKRLLSGLGQEVKTKEEDEEGEKER